MSTQSIRLRPPLVTNWIISGREDLTWFIGSSAISYAVLGLMAAGFPLTPLYLVWLIGIDGPHVAATITRTYLDNRERQRLGRLLWVAVPAMLIGPVMVRLHAEGLFYVIAISWLHFHIAKQHYGFMMLYKHKARERNATDMILDKWFLMASLMLPFGRFVLVSFYPLAAQAPVIQGLQALLFAGYIGLGVAFLYRQVKLWKEGVALNLPKLMLLIVVVPLQWLAFGYAATSYDGVIRAGIVVGLFHSFQYHRLMWFHNHNHYTDPQFESTAGIAATLARRFAYYFGAAVLLNLVLNILPSYAMPSAYVKAGVWGIAFTHYILDSKIWRVRGNKELAAALRL